MNAPDGSDDERQGTVSKVLPITLAGTPLAAAVPAFRDPTPMGCGNHR